MHSLIDGLQSVWAWCFHEPLFKVARLSDPEFSSIAIIAVPLCATLLAFCFFVMNWGHSRLADWESHPDPPRDRLGAPALVCWVVSMGQFVCCVIGMHVYLGIYVRAVSAFTPARTFVLALASLHYAFAWVCMGWMMWWYVGDGGDLRFLERKKLDRLLSHKPFMGFALVSCLVCGIGFLTELVAGDVRGGLIGLLYILFACFAPGAYTAIRGDFLTRAVLPEAKPDPQPEPPPPAAIPSRHSGLGVAISLVALAALFVPSRRAP